MTGNHSTRADLEPLIKSSSSEATSSRANQWRFNKKFRILGKTKEAQECGRLRLGAILCGFTFLLIYLTNLKSYQPMMVVKIPEDDDSLPGPKVQPGYLVYSSECQMLSLNPLAPDVMKLFKKEEFEPCSKKKPLTSIEQDFDTGTVKLLFHKQLKTKYLRSDQDEINCCYQEITRSGQNATADDKFNLSKCQNFYTSFELPPGTEFILIQCKGSHSNDVEKKNAKSVYVNAHAIVAKKAQMQKVFDNFKTLYPEKRPLSVLMLGIDSISRLNLIRALPNTAQHLYDSGWFELKGYNKIDDNTFPNLMAILTGFNQEKAYAECDPKQIGKLDKCPFMWNYFKDSGYATGYAEDEAKIGTFNYHKLGFHEQPTTHYFRPFAMAAEKYLKIKYKSSLKFCLGFQNYADFIYQYALDFATAYKEDPFFGLFWTNSFSHNQIADPSSLDLKIKFYLEDLENRGILNNSAVIFFSDHGIRFGPVRQLMVGWFEERLPFMFIWLPPWFKSQHPEIVQNLKINRNRLTNPYDLHMTLKQVLELSGRVDNLPPASSCSECQSVFKEAKFNRSCSSAAIAAHWCACTAYQDIDKRDSIVKKAVKFTIESINSIVAKAHPPNSTKALCAQMHLKTIFLAKKSDVNFKNTPNEYSDYLLMFDVTPSAAKFESTVRRYHNGTEKFEITGSISRLNEYSSQSYCVNTDNLKKYCFCIKRKKRSGWVNFT